MKFVVGVVVASLAVIAGYLAISSPEKEAQVATNAEPPEVVETVETTDVAASPDVVTTATAQAAEQVTDAVSAVVTEAQEQVNAAAEGMGDTVSEAVAGASDAAADAVNDVIANASEAVTENAGAVEEAVAAVMAAKSSDEGILANPAELFSVEGFDFDKASEFITGSDLNPLAQTALVKGLETARDNPELLSAALEKARVQLGL